MKTTEFVAVCVNAKISATLTLLAQRDNFCRRTPAKKSKSETPRPCEKKFETPRPKEAHEKRDFVTRHKSFRDSEIGSKIAEIHDFLGTIRHPYNLKLALRASALLNVFKTAFLKQLIIHQMASVTIAKIWVSVKRGLGVGVGVFFSFSFLVLIFVFFFLFFLSLFFAVFLNLYDNNGNTQRLGTNRELRTEYHGMPCFQSFFPLKWSRDKPSLFTRWKDELNHGRRRGCSFLFMNLLVKGNIIAACMFCFLSFLGR